MNPIDFLQLKAFARQEGTYLGLIWIVSFACYIGEFNTPALGVVALALAMSSPFFIAIRLKKFRDNIRNGMISYKRGLAFCILSFFYASLLFAIAQFIYFRFIDHGFLLNQYNAVFASVEAKKVMEAMAAKTEIENGIRLIASMRPIEIVFNFLSMNISIGIILSLPIAVLMKSAHEINKINKQQ